MLKLTIITIFLYYILVLPSRASKSTSSVPVNRLDIPVPFNEDLIGIRIPYYNERGRLEVQFDARLAHKRDESHAIFTDLIIHLLEANNYPFHIEMPSGILDLQSQILYGHNTVTLHCKGMYITAKSVLLQAKSRLIQLKEDIKVVLFTHRDSSLCSSMLDNIHSR